LARRGWLVSEQERAALRWAETVTRVADTAVPDSDFQNAAAHFTQKELADLTIAIGLMKAYSRLAISFRTTPAPLKR
jgi:alkylhydroperoxidase family enzyme